jgi:hypothetical protein
MDARGDLYGRRKDGREVPIEIGLNPLRTPEGTFVLSAIADITARKQAEEALRETDRRKDDFLGMLAHDLRNPLAALTSALRLLRIGVRRDDALTLAERQVTRLTRLVEDLLDVARVTQGKIVLHKEMVDLQEVVQFALASARPALALRGHELHVSLPAEPVRFEADRVRLEQVLGNLLDNAAKYSDDGARWRSLAAPSPSWESRPCVEGYGGHRLNEACARDPRAAVPTRRGSPPVRSATAVSRRAPRSRPRCAPCARRGPPAPAARPGCAGARARGPRRCRRR